MDAEWIKSPSARRVVALWADPRPAWLWSQDGQTLCWRNRAAQLFLGKIKKHGVRLAAELTPIRGQVARIIRLGSMGRSSLSRIQFLSGAKPVSVTCACTPVTLSNGQTGLLIAGVDPVERELLAVDAGGDGFAHALLPEGAEYLIANAGGDVTGGSAGALLRLAPYAQDGAMPRPDLAESQQLRIGGEHFTLTRLKASGEGSTLLLFEPLQGESETQDLLSAEAAPDAAEKPDAGATDGSDHAGWFEPEPMPLPVEDDRRSGWLEMPQLDPEPVAAAETIPATGPEPEAFAPTGPELEPAIWAAEPLPSIPPVMGGDDAVSLAGTAVEADALPVSEVPFQGGIEPLAAVMGSPTPVASAIPAPEVGGEHRLSMLFDRLVSDEQLFRPLTEADDALALGPAAMPAGAGTAEARAAIDTIAVQPEPEPKPALFRVIGRGFWPLAMAQPAEAGAAAAGQETPTDPENVERVSRYNFDELGRILTDRIGGDGNGNGPVSIPSGAAPATIEAIIAQTEPPAPVAVAPATTGALVSLGGETLVLNRLPLGILVFRDQQVLFANRAITEMTGYDSVEALRNAGLAAIFPAGDGAQEAGPINHIVQRGGALVPVTARLQSISWQGRPALMLSASATEVRTGHEAAVRAFAEALAEARGDGFVETSRNGVISLISAQGRIALKRTEPQLLGRPLAHIVDAADAQALKEFLERPARYAETARPCLSVKAVESGVDLLLFAQGQAGVVTGYFGLLRQRDPGRDVALPRGQSETDPALLARLSRGLRRPLNTIIGFSDLIRTSAFGTIDNPRYLEYAQDIKTAGYEIAALVDELDDYTRLKDGRYEPRHADVDLAALLDSCVMRVRAQAGAARVLVRSAISERLPKVTADRASLGQAVLNLLASAIDQTPVGGAVVLSAQLEDDGSVSVHVRDSAATMGDLSEQFVVFRDGVGRNGETLAPVRSSVGLALTRSLLAVNALSLSVAPTGGTGTLFSLVIPADLVAKS